VQWVLVRVRTQEENWSSAWQGGPTLSADIISRLHWLRNTCMMHKVDNKLKIKVQPHWRVTGINIRNYSCECDVISIYGSETCVVERKDREKGKNLQQIKCGLLDVVPGMGECIRKTNCLKRKTKAPKWREVWDYTEKPIKYGNHTNVQITLVWI
jgi:hypothetical protein